jgi:toxin ParE1/3/4
MRLEPAANARLDEIYEYTANHWDEDQADRYIRELFECFGRIARKEIVWRTIPAAFGAAGYRTRCNRHFVYWGDEPDGIAIAAILHERMSQAEGLRSAFDDPA